MRDATIVGAILLAILFGTWYTQSLLQNQSDKILQTLSEISIQLQQKENHNQVVKKANQLYQNWKKTSDMWSIVIDHQELDAIEKSILLVKTSVEIQDDTRRKNYVLTECGMELVKMQHERIKILYDNGVKIVEEK